MLGHDPESAERFFTFAVDLGHCRVPSEYARVGNIHPLRDAEYWYVLILPARWNSSVPAGRLFALDGSKCG